MKLLTTFRPFIFFSIFFLCINLLAADSIDVQAAADARLDSILNATSKTIEELDRHYVSILEKTNSQLSLCLNPYAIFIAALGVLFTVGAIFAAYLIYNQGRDFKAKQQEVIDKNDEAFKKAQEDYSANLAQKFDETESLRLQLLEIYKRELASFNSKDPHDKDSETPSSNQLSIFEDKLRSLQVRKIIYHHSGRNAADVPIDIQISKALKISAHIILNRSGQDFTLYCKILGSDNDFHWLAFSGNEPPAENKIDENEYKIRSSWRGPVIEFSKNILLEFTNGFGKEIKPISIAGLRFRASDRIKQTIRFQIDFEI
jgi:hypothetical protein